MREEKEENIVATGSVLFSYFNPASSSFPPEWVSNDHFTDELTEAQKWNDLFGVKRSFQDLPAASQ
jgi:hypothetical protein